MQSPGATKESTMSSSRQAPPARDRDAPPEGAVDRANEEVFICENGDPNLKFFPVEAVCKRWRGPSRLRHEDNGQAVVHNSSTERRTQAPTLLARNMICIKAQLSPNSRIPACCNCSRNSEQKKSSHDRSHG